jgi:hypothetical protein
LSSSEEYDFSQSHISSSDGNVVADKGGKPAGMGPVEKFMAKRKKQELRNRKKEALKIKK